jgi:hypothetical protein
MNGIWVKKNSKIQNPQALWDRRVRYIYTDISENSSLINVANTCALYGFKLGLYHRLRYPPELGSADTQAQQLASAFQNFMNQHKDVSYLPFVLVLEKASYTDAPVLPETNYYRDSVNIFLRHYLDYGGPKGTIVRMSRNILDWIAPIPGMVTLLWLYEPTTHVDYSPFNSYVFRSYAARDINGNMAEWVDEWADRQPTTPPNPPPVNPPPVTPALTDKEKLALIKTKIASIEAIQTEIKALLP